MSTYRTEKVEAPNTEVFKLLADIRKEMKDERISIYYDDGFKIRDRMVEILTRHMIKYGSGQ